MKKFLFTLFTALGLVAASLSVAAPAQATGTQTVFNDGGSVTSLGVNAHLVGPGTQVYDQVLSPGQGRLGYYNVYAGSGFCLNAKVHYGGQWHPVIWSFKGPGTVSDSTWNPGDDAISYLVSRPFPDGGCAQEWL